ncbi:MAG: SDR family oxidoreductase [Candidatus Sungiibacteriota bacterium]|uniref:SDR family oxidoreductase n=1 Tax=Candidatus Sungiibacteriota bacterium TaxID=2750080 RepID=A0A7T5RKL6_9BACT|nr:MAG: SDR family oxidoreductase [Candidatus Sungbacteria bacterium]
MNLNLKNRTVLITGGSRGVGKAIARAFVAEGARVVICGRDAESLRKAREELCGVENSCSKTIFTCVLDATKSEEAMALFSPLGLISAIGSLDVLVNNVGGAESFGGFCDLKDRDWIRAYELNFMSAVYFSREALPWLQKSGNGRIINISSVPARQPGGYNPHYSAAKAALLNLSKHLANQLGQYNILVNAICPSTLRGGGWDTNVKKRALREGISEEEAARKTEETDKKKNPLSRLGTLEDVANLVVFLASPVANFITGTCIDVDGGTVRSIV